MKILKRALTAVVLAALFGSSSALADDPPNFDFLGYIDVLPTEANDSYRMISVITNNCNVPTPIPMSCIAGEHTLVIDATLQSISGFTETYTNATVQIITDSGPSTAPDYANPGTFTDGTIILSGVINNFQRVDFPAPGEHLSSYSGSVSWTGGTRLGELGANTTGWGIGGGGNTQSGTLPPNYEECWDGKIDQPVVAVEDKTWSGVKNLFQE